MSYYGAYDYDGMYGGGMFDTIKSRLWYLQCSWMPDWVWRIILFLLIGVIIGGIVYIIYRCTRKKDAYSVGGSKRPGQKKGWWIFG